MTEFIKYRSHPSVYTKPNAIKLCHGRSLIITTGKILQPVLPLKLHSHAERQVIQCFAPAEVFTQSPSVLHEKLIKVDVLCSVRPELMAAGGVPWHETRSCRFPRERPAGSALSVPCHRAVQLSDLWFCTGRSLIAYRRGPAGWIFK